MFLALGFIIGFITCSILNSSKTTKKPAPIYVESNVEDDIRAIRRLKEIEFWQNFGNDK